MPSRDPETAVRMTEPLIVSEIAVSGFMVNRDVDVLRFTGWVNTHVDESAEERRIVLRFEMGGAQARMLRSRLNTLLCGEH